MRGISGTAAAVIVALAASVMFDRATAAMAANISGNLAARNGHPQAGQQIHFEDRVTHVLFLVQTGAGGEFSAELPPGIYDLRGPKGAMLESGIAVEREPVALGIVREPSMLNLFRFLHFQGVARSVVTTPAPSTSNIPGIEQEAEGSAHPSAR